MGAVLDIIRQKEILEQSEPINMDWTSPSFSLDDREDEFSINVFYENGVAFSGQLVLQVSADNINFADISESIQSVTDSSGFHMWDIAGSGALYARVKVVVSGGSVDITRIFYAGKQRH
jgi:uncharacterized protein YdeI (BOF family)